MKKNLVFLMSILFALTLTGQTTLTGAWKGKINQDGKSTNFILWINNNGTFTIGYDLNPNQVNFHGRWTYREKTLMFTGSDEELQLQELGQGARPGKKGFYMEFVRGQSRIRFGSQENAAKMKIFGMHGWGDGVVLNHEEM